MSVQSSCGLPGHLQCQVFIEPLVVAAFFHSLEYIIYVFKHKFLSVNITLCYVHMEKYLHFVELETEISETGLKLGHE